MTDTSGVVDDIAAALGWEGSVSPELGWDTVEGRLKTRFPGDFKEFMGRFPSGMFRDVVRLVNPVQSDEFLTAFEDQFENMLTVVELMRQECGTYPPFPEPGGLIPFASDSAGGSLLWLPRSPDPDSWHVVHLSRNVVKGYTTTKRSTTAVLRELATSRSERNILGWDLAATDRSFELFS